MFVCVCVYIYLYMCVCVYVGDGERAAFPYASGKVHADAETFFGPRQDANADGQVSMCVLSMCVCLSVPVLSV